MHAALDALVASWPARGEATATSTKPPISPAISPQGIAIDADLRRQLEVHCLDCHDREPERPDLSRPLLERAVVLDMLESVSFGTMPKDHPLAEPDRQRFVDAFIGSMWSGADAANARAYFVDRDIAAPAFRPEVTLRLIAQVAGTHASGSWRMMETAVRSNFQQVTPGFAVIAGLAATDACRASFKRGPQRSRCIADALRLQNLTPRAP
jgi:hypothetical protein